MVSSRGTIGGMLYSVGLLAAVTIVILVWSRRSTAAGGTKSHSVVRHANPPGEAERGRTGRETTASIAAEDGDLPPAAENERTTAGDLEDLIRDRLPFSVERLPLPEPFRFFGSPTGPQRLRVDARHEVGGPHFGSQRAARRAHNSIDSAAPNRSVDGHNQSAYGLHVITTGSFADADSSVGVINVGMPESPGVTEA